MFTEATVDSACLSVGGQPKVTTHMTSVDKQRRNREDVVLRGASICPGIGIGRLHIVDLDMPARQESILPRRVATEQQRYTAAVEQARSSLHEHVAIAHGDCVPEAKAILDIHQAMLADESFHDQVRQRIAAERKTAESSVRQVAAAIMSQFNVMRDPYFQARGEDIRDMAHNLVGTLLGRKNQFGPQAWQGQVLLSRHLHSSDVIMAQRNGGSGFATESRALVSHAAILLKGFGIPAVGALAELTASASEGDRIVVDGTSGLVILRPSAQTLAEYQANAEAVRTRRPTAAPICVTADGKRITLKANIENPKQVDSMLANGLEGIGLFRTEFMISANGTVPAEEEQYNAYREVVGNSDGRTVIIRTFDIGGDKQMGLSERCTGRNPSLGLRGIRRHLVDRPEELRAQLRAILRASSSGPVGILIPMVTTLDDIVAASDHLLAAKKALRAAGAAFSPDTPLGAMIETPAAAASVREILGAVSFISIGTNDLLQYFMAADRDNERVARYNDAASPAFLWLMEHIIEQARRIGREADVTICGEVSSDTKVLPHLLRMGYRSFSVSPVSASLVRKACAAFR